MMVHINTEQASAPIGQDAAENAAPSKGEVITVWISKYALTDGVRAKRAEYCGSGMVVELKPDGSRGWGHFHRPDWHMQKSDADARAEVMRLRKIAAVKKQLARLEALSFGRASGVTPDRTAANASEVAR